MMPNIFAMKRYVEQHLETVRDWLKEDGSRTDLAIEEFLRFIYPVQFTKPRFVRRDIELDGVGLRRGDRVMAMLAAQTWTPPRPIRIPSGSICSARRTGTSPSAPKSIFASAISLPASRARAR
jgi:hypothetical protein